MVFSVGSTIEINQVVFKVKSVGKRFFTLEVRGKVNLIEPPKPIPAEVVKEQDPSRICDTCGWEDCVQPKKAENKGCPIWKGKVPKTEDVVADGIDTETQAKKE